MSVKSRLDRLENATGIGKINVANELTMLKDLSLAGKAPPDKTIEDYEKLIKECDNPELIKLYQATIKAIS